MRTVGLAVAALLALAGCRDSASSEPETTVPTAPSTSATTATTVPSYDVPSVIDMPYIERVMTAIDHVTGEAARYMDRRREVDPEFVRYLAAIHGSDSLVLEQQVWGEVINQKFAPLRSDPGDPTTVVDRIIEARPDCVVFEAKRDFLAIFKGPGTRTGPRYVGLVRQPAGRDAAQINPTPWIITFDGRFSDGSVPTAEEACKKP